MAILNGKTIMLAGLKGAAPEIGENGNWWIDGEDTGKPARGATGATGATGKDGQQGRGYYRTEMILSTATASIERSKINPTNCKLLVSDTIVDKNGLVFAVTKECDVGDETVYISHRTSLKGADGLGVPAGGTTGQVLTKLSDADNDTVWKDPSGGASYKIKQVSVSSGETIYSVVDKITSAIEEELTAQSRSSAVVTVALNDLTISDAVMSGNSAGRVFLETSYMSATSGVSQNKIVFITPLVRAVGDITSVWGSGSWAVTVQFGKFESNIIALTGMAVAGGADFKDLSNFVSDVDTTIDIIIY